MWEHRYLGPGYRGWNRVGLATAEVNARYEVYRALVIYRDPSVGGDLRTAKARAREWLLVLGTFPPYPLP